MRLDSWITDCGPVRLGGAHRASEQHLDPVLATVVGQGDERFSRERGPIQADPGDAAADSLRVLDRNPIEGAAMTVGDLEAFPQRGNARIDAERGTSLP